jgi:hypothetical protein
MRERDEAKFWFCDSQHWPNVFRPFETIMVEFACKCLGQYNTRHLLVPSANGVDYRILNGYCYMSPVAVDPSQIEARVPHYGTRRLLLRELGSAAGELERKVRSTIADLEAIAFKPLPPVVPIEDITAAWGSTRPSDASEIMTAPSRAYTDSGNIILSFSIWLRSVSGLLQLFKQAFPTSPTRRSQRWCRGSRWSYSVPTKS